MNDILIVAGPERKATLELIGAARQIAAQSGAPVAAAVCGPVQDLPVQTIYHAAGDHLAAYEPDLCLEALVAIYRQVAPAVMLFTHDSLGQELAPRLAARLSAGCVTDCTAFVVRDGRLLARKPVFGGKAVADYASRRPTLVLTLRPQTHAPASDEPGVGAKVVSVPLVLSGPVGMTRVVEHIRTAVTGPRLEDARVIVAGGRGLGGPEAFQSLQQLAETLGGAVGATRAACDAGWCPASWQIGQTGKIVAPHLYIAIGISGATQHLAGITNAKTVVAINADAEAPIFKRATLGVVAEYRTVLPALIEECRRGLA